MKKKPNYYKKIIEIFNDLHELYPSYTIGRHIATIIDDYDDVWGMSDKEFLYAIRKYRANLQMDSPHEEGEEEIQKIIHDGLNLSIYSEEEDG